MKCRGSLSFDIIVNEMGDWTVHAYLLSWTLFHRWTSFDWNIQLKVLLLLRVLDAKCRSMKIIHASTILATCKGWSLYKISLATAPLKNLQCQPSHAIFGPCTSCPLFKGLEAIIFRMYFTCLETCLLVLLRCTESWWVLANGIVNGISSIFSLTPLYSVSL